MKIIVFLLLTSFSCLAFAKSDSVLEIVSPTKTLKLSLNQLKSKLKVHTFSIDDPVYKAAKSFDGFALKDVLALADVKALQSADEIIFTAKDGYAPNTSFKKLDDHAAYLVFQEHGMKGMPGKVQQGKSMVSPAPYYVAWAEGKKLAEEVPWPYQLIKIEVVDFATKYPKIIPRNAKDDSAAMAGFRIFKNECLRCHSINLEGGDLGPELNIPKNITEYWNKETLREFIRNPVAFRLKSKMPPFAHLKSGDIDHVLEYLEAMKAHKQQ